MTELLSKLSGWREWVTDDGWRMMEGGRLTKYHLIIIVELDYDFYLHKDSARDHKMMLLLFIGS